MYAARAQLQCFASAASARSARVGGTLTVGGRRGNVGCVAVVCSRSVRNAAGTAVSGLFLSRLPIRAVDAGLRS